MDSNGGAAVFEAEKDEEVFEVVVFLAGVVPRSLSYPRRLYQRGYVLLKDFRGGNKI